MAEKYVPTVLCSVCAGDLKMIDGTGFDGYGWCKHCDCWRTGVV